MQPTLSTDELSAWIRLTLEPDLGPAQARTLLAGIGLPQDIYAMSTSSLAKFLPHDLARQLHLPPGAQIETAIARTLEWLGAPNHHLITLADPAYPRSLLDIHDPPLLLYVNGNPEHLARPMISIVGARSATAAGVENAHAFAQYLAEQGWCVASGLALGIDAAAHRGALRAGQQGAGTVAILGTGIDIVYPSQNRELAHQIAQQGALISEFPLGTRAIPFQFPKRNRIVAGLSQGVLVVEAALQSGSLITARLALETGREVFAIPGSIHSPLSRGCHALIRQGAKLVESGRDIHDELGLPKLGFAKPSLEGYSTNRKTELAAKPASGQRSNNVPGGGPKSRPPLRRETPQQATMHGETHASPALNAKGPNAAVLAALGYDPVHLDTLQARTQLDLGTLNSQLLELELNETIARLDDGRFQRCRP
ncbi:MAG TPA: DNA-processing protein DprA [Eoetvoesiella sp.]